MKSIVEIMKFIFHLKYLLSFVIINLHLFAFTLNIKQYFAKCKIVL